MSLPDKYQIISVFGCAFQYGQSSVIQHFRRETSPHRKNQAAPPFGVVVPEKPAELDRPANLPSEKGVVDRFVFIEAPDPGDQLRIILAPKGGGSENMSAVRMLKPSDGKTGVVNFVVETVRNAGGNPCPPTIVGVGIGGTMEKAALLAKRALLRPLGQPNPDPRYAALEQEILEKINATGVGPQGLGGDITSLAVHIDFHPCHIASMPVALNLNCHAARHAEVTL